ncbi:MAG: AIPR family protein [Eubacterium sp.]|nr:AIPR family protein [Eubacterium sp.]CDD98629.1 possible abortive infection phage resistance protein [Roseburia sp. CAG:471]
MDIAKQIIDQRVNKILNDNPELFSDVDQERKRSKAFLLLGVAAYLDIDIAEAVQFITDGGNDGGFDAAYIAEAQDSQLNVVLFQSKYSRKLENESNFPANAVEKAVNTVKCVFDPEATIQLNEKSREKVDEIRSFILDGHIPYVTFVMLNNGLKWNQDGQNHIDNAFARQEQVHFVHFSHKNIMEYINRSVPIKTQLNFSGKAIQEDFNYKRVILGRVSVREIYNLMEEFGDRLLEKNIRHYLGVNTINEKIGTTLLSEEKRQNFFFFNNGITMICEKFSYNGLQDRNWNVKIDKLQIINGGQTCKTIYQTLEENPNVDFSQVYILVRLYEVNDDEDIIQDITYATNSQNPVDFRDLKSNDEIQKLLEISANDLGYIYKRKRDNHGNTNVIPSTVAAEAVFAVWRGKPHLAKYKRNEFFDQYYDEIFSNLNAAQMIIAVIIFRYCDSSRKRVSNDAEIQSQRPFSQYFLAYMVGKRLLKTLNIKLEKLTHENFTQVKSCLEEKIEEFYQEAETQLIEILKLYFNKDSLKEIDGRTMAAVFRRFDILLQFLDTSIS